ncbi:Crp/Fnr family transcriptional regulator [Kribbella sp. NPDC056861]|uniref:Crp/Fnr family transcriptional regulator n=1 Tax=Kribbella sp. NPDC056861 TaxID=3154857 RepID=UPI003443B89D
MDTFEQPDHETFAARIGPQAWRILLTTGDLRSYNPGRALLRQGDPGGFVLVLESGRVKVLAGAEDGAQLMLTVRGAGHLLGELAGDAEGRRTATIEAIDQCTARYLALPAFERFLTANDLTAAFRGYVTGKFDQAVTRQVDLAHRLAVRRIAQLLFDMVRFAPPGLADPLRVPFTQEELAASLGMSRSTVTDQLAKLRRSGALGPGPQLVVADLTRLREWAEA